jgi:aminomethyltransferase
LGAIVTDFAGWTMPLRYGSELAEHRAVREAAGLFDLSHMAEIEVLGSGAGAALNYAVVGQPSAIQVGRARYTMLCSSDGGVLDDLVVYRLQEQRFLVVANAGNASVVAAALRERAYGFAADVVDKSSAYALIAVQGPRASMIVASVANVDVTALPYYSIAPAQVGGDAVLLARTGYTGEDGFELYCAVAGAQRLWQTLTDAGSPHGLAPAGLACRDTLRLEAGMPLYGNELHAGVTPFEAGLGRVVKFDKPDDFVGRHALAARRDEGPKRVLVGLSGTGRRSARHGYAVLSPDSAHVGEVTSGALSPTLTRPVAMAYVPTELSEPGTRLAVDIRGRVEPVEVVLLPFYRRSA